MPESRCSSTARASAEQQHAPSSQHEHISEHINLCKAWSHDSNARNCQCDLKFYLNPMMKPCIPHECPGVYQTHIAPSQPSLYASHTCLSGGGLQYVYAITCHAYMRRRSAQRNEMTTSNHTHDVAILTHRHVQRARDPYTRPALLKFHAAPP